MKNISKITIVLLMITVNMYAQSTEKFIRIIGNAKKEITAKKVKVYFTIKEIVADSHNNTQNKSFDEVYDLVITELNEMGIRKNEIVKSFKKLNRYEKAISQNFFLETNFNLLDKLNSMRINGFRITDIKYIIPKIDTATEIQLSLDAINDAKRKAKAISDKLGRKLGAILNIEVKSNDLETNTSEYNEISKFQNYKVSITFKLLE